MNLTVIFLTILCSLLTIYVLMLKKQVHGLLQSYKSYCDGFCKYHKVCKELLGYPEKTGADVSKVIEQTLSFYANNLLRDIQSDSICKLKVEYACMDGGTQSVEYQYNSEPAKYALNLVHAISTGCDSTVLEDLKSKIVTGINTSIYNEISNTLKEIEKIAAYAASAECKNRRREAKKILKLLQIIKNTKGEII